jgi:hypothetical protein
MQRELIRIFQGLPKNSDWVFSKGDGLPLIIMAVFRPFKAVLASLGIVAVQFTPPVLFRHAGLDPASRSSSTSLDSGFPSAGMTIRLKDNVHGWRTMPVRKEGIT